MGKKGFTLVELLAVIVLLAVIMVIAVPAIGGITGSINQNMLDEKIELIEEAAILYGQNTKGRLITNADNLKYNNYNCMFIKVGDLVPNYLDADSEDENCSTTNTCVVDPSNENNFLDNLEVIIYYKNKRIKAKVDIDNNLSCTS